MTTMHDVRDPVNLDDASSWPSWCDSDRWELGPDPEEIAWAAQAFGDDDTGFEVEVLDELAAATSAAVDAMELGLIPRDLAIAINRTSLAGSDPDAEAAMRAMHPGEAPELNNLRVERRFNPEAIILGD